MRIISGTHKGRKIETIPMEGLRPSSDRLRNGLFSALTSRRDLTNCRILDLYAGTGALGIEALSRGARHATFIESNKKLINCLRDTLQKFGLTPQARVITGDLPGILSNLNGQEPFDVVFADAPYELDVTYLGAALKNVGAIVSGTDLVVETSKRAPSLTGSTDEDSVDPEQVLKLVRELRYGDSLVRLYEYC